MENTKINNIFSMTPMNQTLVLEPGQTYTGSISVSNSVDATNDLKYTASVAPYGVVGTDYAADLVSRNNHTLITDWITIINPTGTVSPNNSATIDYVITVPDDAPGGGQYAAIAVSSEDAAPSQSNDFAFQQVIEMASILYAEVPGEVQHAGELLENNFPSFITQSPLALSAKVSNTGNVHESFAITIEAYNLFTEDVYLSPTEDSSGIVTEIIMPDTERYSVHELTDLPTIGIIHVDQTVHYLGQNWTESHDVIICPIWFIALIALTIAAIAAAIVSIIVRHRRRHHKKSRTRETSDS